MQTRETYVQMLRQVLGCKPSVPSSITHVPFCTAVDAMQRAAREAVEAFKKERPFEWNPSDIHANFHSVIPSGFAAWGIDPASKKGRAYFETGPVFMDGDQTMHIVYDPGNAVIRWAGPATDSAAAEIKRLCADTATLAEERNAMRAQLDNVKKTPISMSLNAAAAFKSAIREFARLANQKKHPGVEHPVYDRARDLMLDLADQRLGNFAGMRMASSSDELIHEPLPTGSTYKDMFVREKHAHSEALARNIVLKCDNQRLRDSNTKLAAKLTEAERSLALVQTYVDERAKLAKERDTAQGEKTHIELELEEVRTLLRAFDRAQSYREVMSRRYKTGHVPHSALKMAFGMLSKVRNDTHKYFLTIYERAKRKRKNDYAEKVARLAMSYGTGTESFKQSLSAADMIRDAQERADIQRARTDASGHAFHHHGYTPTWIVFDEAATFKWPGVNYFWLGEDGAKV